MNLSEEVDLEDFVSRPEKISAADVASITQEAGMQAVRKNRYVILPKDFEKAYKKVVKKRDTEFDFYRWAATSPGWLFPITQYNKQEQVSRAFAAATETCYIFRIGWQLWADNINSSHTDACGISLQHTLEEREEIESTKFLH